MKHKFNYDIIQIATEKLLNENDIVTEIRFYHELENIKLLYVAHLCNCYDNGEPRITGNDVRMNGKNILIPYIEKSLGKDQIEHMENILIDELSKQNDGTNSKQYFDV